MSKIAELRKAAGLTQENLADKLGIKQGAIAMWESGKAMPRTDKLPLLAQLLGCTIDELFEQEG